MFNSMIQVIKEQFIHRNLIFRMARFEIKGMYQIHYLGSLWQYLNPAIQIIIFWFVFGLGIRGGAPVDGVPFFLWMLMGLIPWFFISPSMVQGSNSVFQKISLVSKMNFPISILPTVKIVNYFINFLTLISLLIIILIINGIYPNIYWIQLIYYIFCLIVFIFSFTLLSSTISTLVRDYQALLQSTMRMLLYMSPILWDTGMLPSPILENILRLNPLFYIITGFRNSFLGVSWFFSEPIYTLYFWIFTFCLLYFGSKAHMKFRKNFMDYI